MNIRPFIKKNALSILILLFSFLVLFFRCFYGFAWNDEPFYLSTANRFYLGEKFIMDEWHYTQCSALIILPFLTLFREITGSTDGIILFFRIFYLILTFTIAAYSYIKLSKYNKWSSLFIALSFLYYAKLSIGMLSYNTMSICFLYLTLLNFYCAIKEKHFSATTLFITGIFFSLSVLAMPFLAIKYFIYICILFLLYLRSNDTKRVFYRKLLLFPTLGILLIFMLFLFYILPGLSISQALESLPIIFNSSAGDKRPFIVRFIGMFGQVSRPLVYTMPFYLITIVYLVWKRFSLSHRDVSSIHLSKVKYNTIIWILQLLCLCINIYLYTSDKRYCGVHFIALGMFGIYVWLTLNDTMFPEIICWFIPGLFSAMLFYFASNTGLVSIAAGCLFVSIGTFLILPAFFKQTESVPCHKLLSKITILCCLFVLIATAFLRIFYLRDHNYSLLTTRIEDGPAQGIYTSADNAAEYSEILEVIKNEVSSDDQFLISQMACWAYLVTDAQCGAYTTWEIPVSSEYLETFYSLNPHKFPSVVFIINNNYGYRNNDNPRQGYLYDKLSNTSVYEKTEYDCGTLYKRKK